MAAPDTIDPIAGARRYVELSNDHDLDGIGVLLSDDAAYTSSRVGAHRGRDAIIEMMRGFFGQFPDVHWRTSVIEPADDLEARFGFVMTATDAETGTAIERRGTERIRFGPDGLIIEIQVEA